MSHNEMIALKLQMGINPSAQIAPNILLAMWRQLILESAHLLNVCMLLILNIYS